MSLDPAWLFLSLIPSGIGMALLAYGKKMARVPQAIAGIALLVYPYFASTTTSLVVIGAMIGVALWLAVRMGW